MFRGARDPWRARLEVRENGAATRVRRVYAVSRRATGVAFIREARAREVRRAASFDRPSARSPRRETDEPTYPSPPSLV